MLHLSARPPGVPRLRRGEHSRSAVGDSWSELGVQRHLGIVATDGGPILDSNVGLWTR
jgi:hypothetical protein